MLSQKNNLNKGYTIIETMIAVSIFILIVVAGVGALLSANVAHNKSKDLRSIVDNLSFIMEDMSRNIRTGYNYRCYQGDNWSTGDEAGDNILNNPTSCDYGYALVFEESSSGNPADPTDQWVYKIETQDGGVTYNIYKSSNGGLPGSFVQLNSPEIVIDGIASHFSVLGAERLPVNEQQPLVFIRLAGKINHKDTITPFSLQSTVSQRLIDVIVEP